MACPGRGTSSEVDLVVVQGVAPVAVVAEAFPAGGGDGGVRVQGFAETLEAGEVGGNGGVEVDQDLVMVGPGGRADEDGGQFRVDLADASMGEEAVVVEGPQQAVEVFRQDGVGDLDVDARGTSVSLARLTGLA